MEQQVQASKAELFRNQHHSGKLLILPNIWDAMGARLVELIGYPSVATASVATAITNGYADGEKIPLTVLLNIVHKIAAAVSVPVTVDFERGFAGDLPQLRENIRLLIENGAVGLNIEDSDEGHKNMYSIEEQCKKIEAIRETGRSCGVDLVINARTDIYLQQGVDNPLQEAITRGRAYQSAGADCFYPIFMNSYEDITRLVEAVKMPVNVVLLKPIADLLRLENIGVARVSVGPSLLNHALAKMKQVAEGLHAYDTTAFFGQEFLPREFVNKLV